MTRGGTPTPTLARKRERGRSFVVDAIRSNLVRL